MASLLSNDPDETTEPFDKNKFAQLMAQIRDDEMETDEMETDEDEEIQEAMARSLALVQGAGTPGNPLDLTYM